MEDELLTFTNTLAVLNELAEDVKAVYAGEMVKSGHPTRMGHDRLTDTITTKVTANGKEFEVSLNMNKYWQYLEYGTPPHWPPRNAILEWIRIKPVIPRPDSSGRIPTPNQLAFLIARAMAGKSPNQKNLKNPQGGTKGTHNLEKTKETVIPYYIPKIEEALQQDIGDYLRAVFTW